MTSPKPPLNKPPGHKAWHRYCKASAEFQHWIGQQPLKVRIAHQRRVLARLKKTRFPRMHVEVVG